MKRLGNESGQSLIFVALGMAILLGFAALATDIGVMLRERTLAQTAADSAAIAGASSLHYGTAVATADAKREAAANGFEDQTDGVTVAVSYPTSVGAYTKASAFVRVTVTKSTPGFFMNVFNRGSMNVSASAVATNAGRSTTCFYVIDPSDSDSMQLQGSFSVNAPSCSFQINSTSGDALHFNGTNGHLTAQAVDVVGGASGQIADSTPLPTLGVDPISDPLEWEKIQTPTGCTTLPSNTLTGLNVGATNNGTVCYSGNVTLKDVTLNPGLYVFTGNVSLSGTVKGTGVTLYLTSGNLSATTNSSLTLSAPGSAGAYPGLLIFDDSPLASPLHTIDLEPGNATGTLVGIIYAPWAQLYIHDSGSDNNCSPTCGNSLTFDVDFVVYQFNDQTGVLTITPYYPTDALLTFPLTSVTLVQ